MKVYVGDTRDKKIIKHCQEHGWGRMVCEDRPFKPFEEEQWALDNGAFVAWTDQKPWNPDPFLRWVDRARNYNVHGIPGCSLAVLPDIVAGGRESLDFSMAWLDRLPPDLPWYLAVQDGMQTQPLWGHVILALRDERIKGIFVGGSNPFKLTAGQWVVTAGIIPDREKLLVHYGRAGTPKKAQHALRVGVDSLDSNLPLWDRNRLAFFTKVVQGQHPQMELGDEWT
jgi:hypothetical protein|tara:strand:+ start:681 stop:1358 length:678 start_codon:yes stop_codon:yes gene_type:complete